MGGLAGVRRGRTAGDLTGGGGRSVEAVRRGGDPRRSGLSRVFGQGYYGPPPPRGGYSGGVVPRFQTGGAPRRTGALHGSITGDPSSGRWTEHFPVGSFWPNVPRLSSIYSGWGTVDKRVPGQTITSFNNQNLPYPNRPPGGGYSGGVIPRFQEGGQMQSLAGAPQAGAQHTFVRPMRVLMADGRYRTIQPEDIHAWNDRFVSRVAGLGAGSAPNKARRAANQARRQESRSPGGGYSGGVVPSFQAGGQFPEPAFPVESELADESPWYPDEEVGYEEAAPMQGGFDIFGRGGG